MIFLAKGIGLDRVEGQSVMIFQGDLTADKI